MKYTIGDWLGVRCKDFYNTWLYYVAVSVDRHMNSGVTDYISAVAPAAEDLEDRSFTGGGIRDGG